MYRFLLTRRWIVASVVVAAAVVVMAELGFWQLRRLHTVRARNADVAASMAMPADPIAAVLPAGAAPRGAEYRRVYATGTYDGPAEIVLEGRSFEGRPGTHLLTPLRVADGRVLIVDRGWVPIEPTAAQREVVGAPQEPVRVSGILFPTERRGAFGPTIPATGTLSTVPRVDVSRIAKQLSGSVFPLYLRLVSQDPPQPGELPVPPGPPELSDGPHLSYAVQWFIFATLALLTFGALARRAARRGGDGT